MWGRVFPKGADNAYRGHWLGIVIIVVVVALKATQGTLSMIDTRNTAINADGIPLDAYGNGAAEMVLSMFALLGMYHLILPLQTVVVLIRWRALIPFMFLLLLAVQLGARVLRTVKEGLPDLAVQPIGFWVNTGIIALTLIGFFLSLMDRRKSPATAGSH